MKRRTLLTCTAGLLVPPLASPAVCAHFDTDAASDRAYRAASDLADALADYDDGRWCASVFPSNRQSSAVMFHSLNARLHVIETYAGLISSLLPYVSGPKIIGVAIFRPASENPVQIVRAN